MSDEESVKSDQALSDFKPPKPSDAACNKTINSRKRKFDDVTTEDETCKRHSAVSDQKSAMSDQAISSDKLQAALDASGVQITDSSKRTFDDVIGKGESWKRHDILLSYATKLDESDLYYMLPDMYQALCYLIGQCVGYIRASTKNLDNPPIEMFLLGFYEGPQPMGPFWKTSFPEKLDDIPLINSRVARILKYARAMQHDLDHCHEARKQQWINSFHAGYMYLALHRRIVREVGNILGTDMNDHDLTKSRVVQIALGYVHHWEGPREDTDEERALKDLGFDCIKAGHLESEDHHPEYEEANQGVRKCIPVKLFSDRLAVHLQKDEPDGQKGWNINSGYIPEQYRDEFQKFCEKHKDKNLYAAWDKAHRSEIKQLKE